MMGLRGSIKTLGSHSIARQPLACLYEETSQLDLNVQITLIMKVAHFLLLSECKARIDQIVAIHSLFASCSYDFDSKLRAIALMTFGARRRENARNTWTQVANDNGTYDQRKSPTQHQKRITISCPNVYFTLIVNTAHAASSWWWCRLCLLFRGDSAASFGLKSGM